MKRFSLLVVLLCLSPVSRACGVSLIGTWQSDAVATMSFNRAQAKLKEGQDEFLASLMGKMTIEFTDKEVRLRMPDSEVSINGQTRPFAGFHERTAYKILFCNARMAVVEAPDAVTGEDNVSTYFFLGSDTMWVYVGNNNPKVPDLHIREYFKRVK